MSTTTLCTRLSVKVVLWCFAATTTPFAPFVRSQERPASLDEAVSAKLDLWGEAALRLPNGPSYEFFENLLPPPRYVNADFRYYPLVLSAPRAQTKARIISNGSGVNLPGGARSWRSPGTPVVFRVGPDEFQFGGLLERVTHPALAEGCLPVVEIQYKHAFPVQTEGSVPLAQTQREQAKEVYRLEAFASTDPALAEHAVVFAKFSLAKGSQGRVAIDVDAKEPLSLVGKAIADSQGRRLVHLDDRWRWERNLAVANLSADAAATLAIPTRPLEGASGFVCSPAVYAMHRAQAINTWKGILARGVNVETPELRVNNAWRNLIIQNFSLMQANRMHYSAGNQYDKLYEAEGGQAALAMMLWGYEAEMREMIVPLLQFTRKGLEYHQAGLKLDDVCRLYWQTRDAEFVRRLQLYWEKEAQLIVNSRLDAHGLLPKERFCGDISTQVHSLSANAKAWRALRDLSAVLKDMGEDAESSQYRRTAAEYRTSILTAIEKSLCRETSPPFVPIALLGDEPAHDPITSVRIGSYWNLMINDVIGSGIFPPGSEQETWIPRYLQERGGLCMGMTRAGGTAHAFWTGPHRVNPLYGTRYVIDLLRRDEPDRALVSFYGMLAQGFTRNTFVADEGCTLAPVDQGGRFFYCPPNSAANGHFLWMLRHLLVQDFDLDDDGEPETLRLLYGVSRRWLEDGKTVRVERAPTAFGPVSVAAHSELKAGRVLVDLDLPARPSPQRALLRIRVPPGWQVVSAKSKSQDLPVGAHGSVDVSQLKGRDKVTVQVSQ